MAAPPSLDGAVQETSACWFPAVAWRAVGADGAVFGVPKVTGKSAYTEVPGTWSWTTSLQVSPSSQVIVWLTRSPSSKVVVPSPRVKLMSPVALGGATGTMGCRLPEPRATFEQLPPWVGVKSNRLLTGASFEHSR